MNVGICVGIGIGVGTGVDAGVGVGCIGGGVRGASTTEEATRVPVVWCRCRCRCRCRLGVITGIGSCIGILLTILINRG